MGKKNKGSSSSDLLETLGDFTSKENWDKFFSIRGNDDSFEWYAEWPQLQEPLLSLLGVPPPSPPLQILVPGCGNSRLSEHLYDAGFHSITNIDFSKVCISDMLRRNVRDRPHMRWRVMDITSMQFLDESFDAVLDKGGLDALMEPKLGSKLGQQYLSEVKRVLKSGGKFICLTLAESHVLELLFTQLRFGWNTSVHAIPHKPSSKPSLQTFMVVAEKEDSSVLNQITSSFDHTSLGSTGNQALGIHEALDNENRIRNEYSNASDILYSLSDLKLGAKGDLTIICHGRRFELILGEQGVSRFTYKAVLLDAHEHSGPFIYDCGVFLVPKTRAHEWLFSSEEGQWMVVESSKAARLIMVLLDSGHDNVSMEDIQKDLSPLVKQLAPGKDSSNQMKVYHGYLASSYHMGIISGFTLISSYLENAASAGKTVKAVVIGLGAGLLPMFLKGCMSCLQIEVVELDPLMLNLAKEYFGFTEDRHMKVHIADGIQFIRESTKFLAADDNGSASNGARAPVDGDCIAPRAESGVGMKVDVLIIDVDSPDSSSGMTCPAADFVEEAFLLTVKETLSEQGLFIANLVSRSPTIKNMVISRMKSVFTCLFCLQLEEDVNLVLFGLSSKSSCKDDLFPKSVIQLEKLLNLKHPEISQSIIDTTKKITCLK